MNLSEHFTLPELMPPTVFNALSENVAWGLLDPRLIQGLEAVRKLFGRVIMINNWHVGGTLKDCGFRESDSSTGAKYSQHKFGRAADLHISNLDSLEVQAFLKAHWKEVSPFFSTMEDGTKGWTHLDCRWVPSDTSTKPFLVPIPK